jgi:hypothetical protein
MDTARTIGRGTLRGFLIILLVGTGLAAAWRLGVADHWLKRRCAEGGGIWLVNDHRCETDACFDQQTCLPSYNNTAVCRSLALGVSERTLTFRLGQPVRVHGHSRFFAPSATAPGLIRATIDGQGVVRELDCASE